MLDLVPRTPPTEADFELRLADDPLLDSRTAELLVGMTTDATGADAAHTAARTRDLAAADGNVRLWISQQDGWIAHRLEGPRVAVAALARRLERDPHLQGVRRLAVVPTPDGCEGLPDAWWLHGEHDGSSRGQVAACLRQAASAAGPARCLWTRLCLPPPTDALAPADPPSPMVVLCRRPGDVASVGAELVQAAGPSTARLRLLTVGRADHPVPAAPNLGVIDRRGSGASAWPSVLLGTVGGLRLLGPLALGARTVVMPIDAGGLADAAGDAWNLWTDATVVGLSTDMGAHRRLIRRAGASGRTYRVADLDPADLRALGRRLLTAWAAAAGFATTR